MKRTISLICLVLVSFCPLTITEAQQVLGAREATRNVARILGIPQEDWGKCGTSMVALAYSRWNQLSPQVRQGILQALQRPTKQKSRPPSPSSRFRIHYDTTGIDTPALITSGPDARRIPNTVEQFIDSVAYYFEYARKLEVDTLGYSVPPTDGVQGGGPEYDIYVEELGTDMFGQTSWSESSDLIENGQRQRYSTYTEVDNDFLGYRTPGMDGLRVTAAHEFHHAVQVGSYGFWTTVPNYDFYFYEITSVWMEHVAFPAVHDYYYYLPNYFERFKDGRNRSLPFNFWSTSYRGYERTIWAHFLAKRFGRDVIRNIWTGMKATPALGSMTNALLQYGTTLESEFALFSYWNYFTADRSDPQRYYDEGKNYPRFAPNASTTFSGLSASVSSSASPLSTQFFQLVLTSDTITAIVANVNAKGAQDPNTLWENFELRLSGTNLQPPYQKVARGLGLTFTTEEIKQWRTLYLQSSTRSNANTAPDPSPNPVRLSQDTKLLLPMVSGTENQAEVSFVNSALELAFSRQYPVTELFGTKFLDIPTSELRDAVKTGIYFVRARCGDAEFMWKVAVVR